MTPRPSIVGRLWSGWIRLLLRCYPPRFRGEMGADLMAQLSLDPPAGVMGLVRQSARACRDLALAGLGARLDDRRVRRAANGGSRRLSAGLLTDTRQVVRRLLHEPVYASAVVLMLGLASGLTAAVFSIYDATLIRALPFPDDQRVVSIGSRWTGFAHASVSIPEYLDYRERARALGSIAAIRNVNVSLSAGTGDPERLLGARVTASYFDVMGVAPVLGRVFSAAEDAPGGPDVAVIRSDLWQQRFAADPSIAGRVITLDDRPVTVLGVMPASFAFPERETQVWLPLAVNPADPGGRGAHNRRVVARLAPDATLADVRAEMSRIAGSLQQEYPSNYPDGSGWGLSVRPLREHLVGDLRAPLRLLLGAVIFVLVIAAANVSGLMLARAATRHPEFAARAALGASPGRLLRLIVLEGLVAGLAGALLGLGLAEVLIRVVTTELPPAVSRPDVVLLDPRAFAFAMGITALASSMAAAYAALRASRITASEALRSAARATETPVTRRVRAALVVGEVALAFILLSGAGLAASSFARLAEVEPGLAVDDVHTARLTMSTTRYAGTADAMTFFERLLDALRTAPGVRQAGAVSLLPLSGSDTDFNFGIEGYVATPGQEPNAQARMVAGEYFAALAIPLRRGRYFDARDSRDAAEVAIVSAALARKYWGETSVIGRRVKLWSADDPGPWRTIVGVVGDVRHFGLAEPEAPILYFPAPQVPQRTMTVVIRTEPGVAGGPLIAAEARRLDPAQPIFASRTMGEWLSRSLVRPRFNLLLLSVFACIALGLSLAGIYSAMAFIVAHQRQDLGIRVALGATPSRLVGRLLIRALRLTLAGLFIGGLVTLFAGRWVATLFHGIRPVEPMVYGVAAVVLVAAAALASAVPARRVLRLDVTTVLKG